MVKLPFHIVFIYFFGLPSVSRNGPRHGKGASRPHRKTIKSRCSYPKQPHTLDVELQRTVTIMQQAAMPRKARMVNP
jgi:hypothetical protein